MNEFTSIGDLAEKIVANAASRVAIGGTVATAVQLHVRALRMLDRRDTTVRDIANALGLPDSVVEQSFAAGISGATLSEHKRIRCPMSRVVKLKETRRP